MAQGQLSVQSLQNDPNIARFMVEGTATGKQLGVGSYGSVEEVRGTMVANSGGLV